MVAPDGDEFWVLDEIFKINPLYLVEPRFKQVIELYQVSLQRGAFGETINWPSGSLYTMPAVLVDMFYHISYVMGKLREDKKASPK